MSRYIPMPAYPDQMPVDILRTRNLRESPGNGLWSAAGNEERKNGAFRAEPKGCLLRDVPANMRRNCV